MEKDHNKTTSLSLVSAEVSVDEQALAQLQQDKAHHTPNGTFRNPWSTFEGGSSPLLLLLLNGLKSLVGAQLPATPRTCSSS